MTENPYELLYMSRMCDTAALQALFCRYYGVIRAIVAGSVDSYSALKSYRDDVMQEAMIALFSAVDTYREDQNTGFRTFLCVVVRRKVWNVLRKYSSGNRQLYRDCIELDAMISEDDTYYDVIPAASSMAEPEYYTGYSEALERMDRTVSGMKKSERAILYSWMRGDSYAEAADRHGISRKAYDGRLQRVRKKIRDAVYGSRQ